jgi:hypothetical protein
LKPKEGNIMAHWIIQKTMESVLKNQYNNSLVEALDRQNKEYTVVEFNINQRDFPHIDNKAVFSYGSIQFNSYIRNSRELNYYPGYINTSKHYEFIHFASYYGRSLLLNNDYKILTFGDVLASGLDNIFIKPAQKHKQFTGFVLNQDNREMEISRLFENVRGQQNVVELHDLVVISSPKKILEEYRCVLGNGEFITGCQYHWDYTLPQYVPVPDDVKQAAIHIATHTWQPDPVFVADFCRLEDGQIKLIELNALSTSGLYHCELDKIIQITDKKMDQLFLDLWN